MEARSKLRTHIEALNEQYAAFISKELEGRKLELWIDGAQQYINHAKGLLEEFKEVQATNGSQQSAPSIQFGGGKPSISNVQPSLNGVLKGGEQSRDTSKAEASTSKPFTGFSWNTGQSGAAKQAEPSSLPQSSWNTGAASAAPFTFGQPAAVKSDDGQPGKRSRTESEKLANGVAAEKIGDAAAKPAFGGFKFPSSASQAPPFNTSGGAPAFSGFQASGIGAAKPSTDEQSLGQKGEDAAEADGENMEEENKDPLARQDDPSTEVVFETKAGLQIQSESKAWANQGKGTLTLRKTKEGPGRPFIVFATDAGHIRMNALLQQGLKTLEKDKNRVMMTLVWKDENSGTAAGHCVLIKLGSAELVKEFLSVTAKLTAQ